LTPLPGRCPGPSIAATSIVQGGSRCCCSKLLPTPRPWLPVVGALRMTDDRADAELEELIRELPASFVPTKFVRVTQLVEQQPPTGHQGAGMGIVPSPHRADSGSAGPYAPAVVDGSVPVCDPRAGTDREREIARFRTDPNCTVLVATPHTLSEGVSLHHTTTHQIHSIAPQRWTAPASTRPHSPARTARQCLLHSYVPDVIPT